MKQRLKTFLLDLLMVFLIIAILTLIRNKLKEYMDQVQLLLPSITNIEQTIQTQNLTTYDPNLIQGQLTNLSSILDKALFLNKFVLPISIIILWFVIQGLVWKELNKTKFKTFIPFTIPLLVAFFVTVYFFLDYLFAYFYEPSSSPILTIIFAIITLVISFITFQSLVKHKISVKPKSIPFFLLFALTSLILLLLLTLTYIFLIVETSIIIPVILIVLILIAINFERSYLIKKLNINA